MNYLPVVGWGFYGGANAAQTANYTGSWGLFLVTVPTVILGGGCCTQNNIFLFFRT